MSGFMRKAALVVGAVALVASTAGLAAPAVAATATTAATAGGVAGVSAATLAAIGTYGGLAAGVLSAVSAATAPGMSNQGSATSFQTNPQSGLPYAMGRTRMSGLRFFADTNTRPGYTKFNDLLWFGALLSIGGQIEQLERFTIDNEVVTFDGSGNAVGNYRDYQGQKLHMGGPQASALALTLGGGAAPGWTAQHRLSGITHAMWALRYNKEGEMYGAGAPEPAWIGKWVRVYDPRLDSTYPGGSGPCRALNEATYVWSQNPGLHALTWALGRWQNGKRTCGIGAPVPTIRIGDFVECANVCDANAWKVGGVEWTTDSKWDTLKRILQAGGARPTKTGAMIGCMVSTPRTAIATIESRHLLDSLSIAATKSRRDRFNSVIPRYVDEDSDWSVISGTAITVPEYVTADKGQRTKEIDYPLVQVFSGETAMQPGQLAAYDIVNSREAGPITFTTGPEWIGLKTGDVVLLNVPEEGLANQPILITRRAPDPATGKVSFSAQTETYSKHAYALGQSTTPPAPFSLTPPDLKPPAPITTSWAATGTTTGEGLPAIVIVGESDMPSADAVLIDYRKAGDNDWNRAAIVSANALVQHVIAPLESETGYQVRIGYRVEQIDGDFIILSAVTGTGKLSGIEDGATDGASPAEKDLLDQLETDTAAAAANIAAAQAQIAAIEGSVSADFSALNAAISTLNSEVDAVQGNISSLQSTTGALQQGVSTLNGQVAQAQGDIVSITNNVSGLSSQVGTVSSNLSDLTTEVGTVSGNLSTLSGQVGTVTANLSSLTVEVGTVSGTVSGLSSQVGTISVDVSALAGRITTAEGQVSATSSTVATQGAQISTNATAISNVAGNLATLTTRVSAAGNPNLLPNGGLENGFNSGILSAGTYHFNLDSGWGPQALASATGNNIFQFAPITVRPLAFYTLSCDAIAYGASTLVYCDVIGYNAGGAAVYDGPQNPQSGQFDFSTNTARRGLIAVSFQIPADVVTVRVRFVGNITSGTGPVGFRQMKLEYGSQWTPYTAEASISQTFQAISTTNAAVATLTTTVSANSATITQQATAISTLQGTTATLSSTVSAQGTSITSLQSVTSTHTGQIAQHTTDISTANANISINATAISAANGNIASLTTRVGSAESSITTNATAISNVTGRTATLESTVSTQTASISSLQTATSTLTGDLATLTTTVRAGNNANLIPGLETGLNGWFPSVTGFVPVVSGSWGSIVNRSGTVADGTLIFLDSPAVTINPTVQYTAAADSVLLVASGTISTRVEILFKDSGGNVVGNPQSQSRIGAHDFTNTGASRAILTAKGTAPSNAVTAQVRLTCQKTSGTLTLVGWRQVKLEQGNIATPYSNEASIAQTWSAVSTATGSLASLTTRVGAAESNITTNATAISTTNGNLASLSSTVSTQGGAITSLQSVTTTQGGTIAQHTTAIATANANITTNATAISTANGNIASLTTRVGSAESSITTNATAISNVTGRTATLESAVSTQGASITSLQTATSTLTGDLATLTTRVRAGGNPNLVPGLEIGLAGWFGENFGIGASGGWGIVASRSVDSNQLIFLDSPAAAIFPGATYTAAADSVLQITGGTGSTRVEIVFKDSAGNITGNPQSASRTGAHDFTNDGTSRATLTASGVAPPGSVSAQVRLTAQKSSGTLNVIGWRQAKLEQGNIATPYTNEASIAQTWSAVSTATGSLASLTTRVGAAESNITTNATAISTTNGNLASLSSTVSTQGGAITSLQSVTTTQGGTIAQHTTAIATANANITTNATAISTVSGQLATLSSTVSTQGASISTLQSTASTLTGNLATLTTRVNASQPNVLPNGGLENGFTGAISTASFALSNSPEWGQVALTTTNGTQVFQFADIVSVQPNATYWISCDPIAYGTSSVYCDLLFLDAAGATLLDGPGNVQAGQFNFSPDDTRRGLIAISAIAPSNTARIRARVVAQVVGNAVAGFRRVKVETGPRWTPFSQEASVTSSWTALNTATTSLASLTTRVSTAEGSVTTLQSSMTSANGSISTLQTNVSSLQGSVSTLQSSSTTQAGQISVLQSTVSTQGATISSNSTAITTMQGSLSTLTNVVAAAGNPNLISGFETGLSSWFGTSFSVSVGSWGATAYRTTSFTGTIFLDSPQTPIFGGVRYTAAADSSFYTSGTGSVRVEILFKDSGGGIVGNPQSQSRYSAPNADFTNDGSSRKILAASGVAPANAVTAQLRLTAQIDSGTVSSLAWRQPKLEQGAIATPYSGEASVIQTFNAYSSLNSSFASLSTTVSSQGGSISTLQSTTTALSGTVSTLSSTVTAQGTSITNLQTVTSTHDGQIATLTTQVVAGGGNLIQNTDFAVDLTSFSFGQNGTTHIGGRNLLGDNYRPANENTIGLFQSNNNGADFGLWQAQEIGVVPLKYYEFSVGAANSRCTLTIYLRFINSSGTTLLDRTASKASVSEGNSLSAFPTIFVRGQAPAGTQRVRCIMVKNGTNTGSDSYAWFIRPQLVEVPGLSGGPVAYSPGATSAMISQQATAISSATGQLATLSSTVSTQGSSISQQATSISTLQGQQASLSSTVSAQGSSISQLQTATSTLQGNVASLTTRVSAAGGNVLPNGGLENGFNSSVSNTGGFNYIYSPGWGAIASTAANGLHVFSFSPVVGPQVGAQYTMAIDPLNFGASDIFCNIVCVDGSGNVLLDGTPGTQISGGDFSNDDVRRSRSACTVTVPTGTASLVCRAYGTVRDSQPIGFRRAKLERGATWTPYSAEATVVQQYQTLSTLNAQYASLSSTVSTLNASVSVAQTAISTLEGRTAAFFQVESVTPGGRAQLRVYSFANGGAGVDIIGDLGVSGNGIFGGTINPEALALQRFMKKTNGGGTGSPSAGQNLLIYSVNMGQTLANGVYSVEFTGLLRTTVGRQTGSVGSKPSYVNHLADGGIRLLITKGGTTIVDQIYTAEEWNNTNSIALRDTSFSIVKVIDPDNDTTVGDAVVSIYAIRGSVDTGTVDNGDYYQRDVSAQYTNVNANAKVRWNFI